MKQEAIVNHIVDWLSDYTRRSGTKGYVVGISGGIDSAVTSALAARTGFPVTCVEMPIYQNQEQRSRARRHIDALQAQYSNVSRVEVNLSAVFDQLIAALPNVADSEARNESGEYPGAFAHDHALLFCRLRR